MDDYARFFKRYLEIAPYRSPFLYGKNSTIGCGGMARIAFFPENLSQTVRLLSALEKDSVPYVVLGNLSNVLPPDGIGEKIVVSTRRLTGVVVEKSVFSYAGTTAGAFLAACKRAGKTGAEFLAGIPCTIGGAAYMNAGADGRYLDETVQSVVVFRRGEMVTLPKTDCGYAYKESVFMRDGSVILGVNFLLHDGKQEEIAEKTEYYLKRRRDLPKGGSMGCVFKNPPGGYAGKLIEGSGLKGLRIGGAYVSDIHANFIINEGEKARDVKALIHTVKNAVYAQYGVRLQEEIRYLT